MHFYTAWLDHRRSMKLDHASVFLNSFFEPMSPRNCTNYVQFFSMKYIGVSLSPLDYRHIRATHHFHSVMNSQVSTSEKAQSIENYAASVGQSSDVMKNHYVYQNPSNLAKMSLDNMVYSNSLLKQ